MSGGQALAGAREPEAHAGLMRGRWPSPFRAGTSAPTEALSDGQAVASTRERKPAPRAWAEGGQLVLPNFQQMRQRLSAFNEFGAGAAQFSSEAEIQQPLLKIELVERGPGEGSDIVCKIDIGFRERDVSLAAL